LRVVSAIGCAHNQHALKGVRTSEKLWIGGGVAVTDPAVMRFISQFVHAESL